MNRKSVTYLEGMSGTDDIILLCASKSWPQSQ